MCDDDVSCCDVSLGPQGDRGYQGENTRGPQGDVGFQSDVVIIGNQGVQGLMGSGTLGPLGLIGMQGPSFRGAQGPQGLTGLSSSNGPQGFEGDRGLQGPDGMSQIGPQGPQGLSNAGALGARGRQGFQGLFSQGPQGYVGSVLSTQTFNNQVVGITTNNTVPTIFVSSAKVGPGTHVVIFDGSITSHDLIATNYTFALPGSSVSQIVTTFSPDVEVISPISLQSRITTSAPSTNVGPTVLSAAPISTLNVAVLVQIISSA